MTVVRIHKGDLVMWPKMGIGLVTSEPRQVGGIFLAYAVTSRPDRHDLIEVAEALLTLVARPGLCPICGEDRLLARTVRERSTARTARKLGRPYPAADRFEFAARGRLVDPMICLSCVGKAAAAEEALAPR